MVGKCQDIAHAQGYKMVVDCCGRRIYRKLLLDKGGSVLPDWHIDQYLGIESLVYQPKWKYQHRSDRFVRSMSSSDTQELDSP